MKVVRYVTAVIIGYATFVVSALLLFKFSGIKPHDDPTLSVMLLTVAFGFMFSFLGGVLAQLISKARNLWPNYILAAILAGFATFSLLQSSGNHYSQIAAIFLFTPASLVGGWVFLKRKKS
ncbi:MAG: hypothetical protein HOP30_08225 [Cyclobacteriaceae bacterium]|nr:hypothetical protein [Cyclobacteriaceae bacterium]